MIMFGSSLPSALGWLVTTKVYSGTGADIVMESITPGDVVAAKMKRAKSHVPIMLLSSYGPLPKTKLEAVDIFLSKSEPPKVLLSTLQHLLNRRRKPFLSRWFDTCRSLNEGERQ